MKPARMNSGTSSPRPARRSRSSRTLSDSRQTLLSRVLDTVPAVIYSADGQTGELLLLEGAVQALTGYTRQAILRDSGLSGRLIHPEDLDRVLTIYREGLAAGRPFELDFRILHARDKHEVWIHSRVTPIVGPDGKLLRHDGVSVDITDRRRMESLLETRVQERTAELKAANHALAESELRYRTLAESAQDAIFIVGRDDRVDYVNPAGAFMFDCRPEELVGRRRSELFPPDVSDRQNRNLRQVFETGKPVTVEELTLFKGRVLWLHTHLVPMRDDEGAVRAVMGVSRNVTDRVQAEQALRESEQKYRTLVENLPVGVFRVIDPEGELGLHVNSAFARMHGFDTAEEVLQHPPASLYADPADRHRLFSTLERTGSVSGWELNKKRKDGTPLVVSVTAHAHFDAQGRMDFVDGIIEDITARKRAAEALLESEAKYRSLVENLNICVFRSEARPGGRIVHINPAGLRMLGFESLEDMQSCTTEAFYMDPADRRRLIETAGRNGFVRNREVRTRRKDGSPLLISITAQARRGPDGELEYLDGIAEDLTERKLAEEQRDRLSRAIENAGEGIGTWDAHWRLTYANTALAQIFGGRTPDEVLGRDWTAFFDGVENPQHARIAERVRGEGRWQGRLLGRHGDGQSVPLSVTLARIGPADGDFLVVANIRDRGTEEAHLAQIRKLTTDREHSIEQERARISRELHDELGQLLTALNMNLAWAAHSAQGEPSVAGRLAEAQGLVNHTLDAVRSLSTKLRPPILDNQGLLDAIRSHAAEFRQWCKVTCRVRTFPADLEVGDPLATIVFRVVQEALTNIARHSKATRCDVSIKLVDRVLEVKIRDNGAGAVPDVLEGVQSLGIAGMKERAAAAGGTLQVENVPGGGVCVTARLPWSQDLTRDDE